MIAQHVGQQPHHRTLPLLTIGLAVLGLIITTSGVWLVQRWQEEARQQEQEAQRQAADEVWLQAMEEARRQRVEETMRQRAACLQDEACRQELAQREACLQDEACRWQLEKSDEFNVWMNTVGVDTPRVKEEEQANTKLYKFIGGAAVTLPVLGCALYVIVSPTYGDADKKWAYGAVGTLLGFWLGAS
jgi:hypothetical protein